ncbi:hypothetical protein SAY86_016697 [Trapa natans]|uniref:X8 domain-containing protein n=1 Tax=Trapa natans TaxID=22666 RepID=A0AAN7LCP8_TRANT|nr:hypothetical protein SAY86_016697 [Trapa natans]
MVLLVVAVLVLAISHGSSATWCTCKEGLSEAVLQKTLDYACGAGADCNPIKQNGVCFQPNTVKAHCSYAVNSYYQKKGQAAGSCDFTGTAAFSAYDPSANGCVYPASATSSAKPTTTPVTTTPTASTPITTTPTSSATPTTTTSPYTATPTGILGGVDPSGINNDISHGGFRPFKDGCILLPVSWLAIALVAKNLLNW